MPAKGLHGREMKESLSPSIQASFSAVHRIPHKKMLSAAVGRKEIKIDCSSTLPVSASPDCLMGNNLGLNQGKTFSDEISSPETRLQIFIYIY